MLERLFMSDKTYIPEGEQAPASQIGATLEALAGTIHARRDAGEGSYTFRLMLAGLAGHEGSHAGMADAFAAKADAACDHLRYEAADVVYHLLVVLERYGIGIDEFAAELNNRMTDEERPQGAIRLFDEHVKRGK